MAYCQSCKKELPAVQKGICPYCGFQNSDQAVEFVFAHRYVVRETFNADRYGISYRGFDTVMGRPVQIRRLLTADKVTAEDAAPYRQYERRERFMDTCRKLAAIEVSSLPTVYTFKADGTGAYAVYAYEPSRTLAQVLAQCGVKSYADAKALLLPVIVALKVMHDRKACHGNVSLHAIRQTDKTTLLCDAVGGTDILADIRAFLMVFLMVLCGSTMSEVGGFGSLTLPEELQTCLKAAFCSEEGLTADQLLDTIYHCGEVAVGKPVRELAMPPADLLALAENCQVKVTALLTSLT